MCALTVITGMVWFSSHIAISCLPHVFFFFLSPSFSAFFWSEYFLWFHLMAFIGLLTVCFRWVFLVLIAAAKFIISVILWLITVSLHVYVYSISHSFSAFVLLYLTFWTSQVAQWWTICLPVLQVRETWTQPLGRDDPLEEEMATHSSILAWEILWTEEPGGLQSMGSQKSWTQPSNWVRTVIFYFYTYYKLHSVFFLYSA